MKNRLLLLFTLFTFSLFGQLKYAAEMGPLINFHKSNDRISTAPFSYYANFGVKRPYKKINLTTDAEWSISNWQRRDIIFDDFSSGYYVQTEFLKIIPGIELKLGKYFSVSAGTYLSIKMNEVLKDNFFSFSGFASSDNIKTNSTKRFDYGMRYGGKVHFSKKIAFTMDFIRGSNNILKKSMPTNNTGTQKSILKNRNLQFGIEFNLSEYL